MQNVCNVESNSFNQEGSVNSDTIVEGFQQNNCNVDVRMDSTEFQPKVINIGNEFSGRSSLQVDF